MYKIIDLSSSDPHHQHNVSWRTMMTSRREPMCRAHRCRHVTTVVATIIACVDVVVASALLVLISNGKRSLSYIVVTSINLQKCVVRTTRESWRSTHSTCRFVGAWRIQSPRRCLWCRPNALVAIAATRVLGELVLCHTG